MLLSLQVTCTTGLNQVPPGVSWVVPAVDTARFRAIWEMAEHCVHRKGDLSRVHWRIAPGNSFTAPSGTVIGYWTRPHTITLATEWLTTDWVIKHEMIHDLLQEGHTEATLQSVWGERCHATWGYQGGADPFYIP